MLTMLAGLPTAEEVLAELLANPEDAERLLSHWLVRAWRKGYLCGLDEALHREEAPVRRTSLAAVVQGTGAM